MTDRLLILLTIIVNIAFAYEVSYLVFNDCSSALKAAWVMIISLFLMVVILSFANGSKEGGKNENRY